MSILAERMIRVDDYYPISVRLWVQDDGDVDEAFFGMLRDKAVTVIKAQPAKASAKMVALALIALECVNAVEVLTWNGNGSVLYRDWP